MTSLHWQTSLQNRQCHALCTLGRTSKCDKVFATYMSFTDLVYYRLGCDLFVFGAYILNNLYRSTVYKFFIYLSLVIEFRENSLLKLCTKRMTMSCFKHFLRKKCAIMCCETRKFSLVTFDHFTNLPGKCYMCTISTSQNYAHRR